MVKFNDPNDGNKTALTNPLFESVFNVIQDGICILDPSLTILRANAALMEWYSHVPNLVGEKCYQVFHGMDQPCKNCPSQRALAHKSPQSDIIPLNVPGRPPGWMELFAYPLLDADGSVSGVVETIRDITQRVEQQNARQRRLASEALITDISTRFINKPHDKVDAEIERSLQISGEFTRSDCCFFKLLKVNGAEIDRLYQWCAPDC
ncbi:MAG: PAS domain-containing protein, partial [Anaerolineaceae bacterium]|nr:PAS domain-containing protein [Anaerolineaceae bacterium]